MLLRNEYIYVSSRLKFSIRKVILDDETLENYVRFDLTYFYLVEQRHCIEILSAFNVERKQNKRGR